MSKWKSKIALIFFLSMGLTACDYLHQRSVQKDLEKKNCESAKNKILKSLQKDSADIIYQYNLIFASLCEENAGRALKQMDYVLEVLASEPKTSSESDFLNYLVLFLKAYIQGELGEVDDALSTYQQALVYKPTDKKIKQNMELLLQSNSGKSKKKKKGGKEAEDSATPNEDQKKGEKQAEQVDQSEKDERQEQEESQQKKALTEQQIEKIMKEIDGDEKKVRSQGIEIKKSKGQKSEKNW